MATELIAMLWDDLDLAETGEKNPAQHKITVGWDGRWYELDLTEQHYRRLDAQLAPYLRAGHAPEHAPAPSRKSPKSPPEIAGYRSARQRGDLVRAFANEHEFNYRTPGGGYYYNRDLREAFAAWEAQPEFAAWAARQIAAREAEQAEAERSLPQYPPQGYVPQPGAGQAREAG
jgi:hypothetical protein